MKNSNSIKKKYILGMGAITTVAATMPLSAYSCNSEVKNTVENNTTNNSTNKVTIDNSVIQLLLDSIDEVSIKNLKPSNGLFTTIQNLEQKILDTFRSSSEIGNTLEKVEISIKNTGNTKPNQDAYINFYFSNELDIKYSNVPNIMINGKTILYGPIETGIPKPTSPIELGIGSDSSGNNIKNVREGIEKELNDFILSNTNPNLTLLDLENKLCSYLNEQNTVLINKVGDVKIKISDSSDVTNSFICDVQIKLIPNQSAIGVNDENISIDSQNGTLTLKNITIYTKTNSSKKINLDLMISEIDKIIVDNISSLSDDTQVTKTLLKIKQEIETLVNIENSVKSVSIRWSDASLSKKIALVSIYFEDDISLEASALTTYKLLKGNKIEKINPIETNIDVIRVFSLDEYAVRIDRYVTKKIVGLTEENKSKTEQEITSVLNAFFDLNDAVLKTTISITTEFTYVVIKLNDSYKFYSNDSSKLEGWTFNRDNLFRKTFSN